MVFPDMSEVKLCSPSSGQGSDCTDKMTLFGQGIHYDHDSIFPIRFRELHYEVNANGVPRCIQERTDFVWRHILHVDTYLPMYLDICGHQ